MQRTSRDAAQKARTSIQTFASEWHSSDDDESRRVLSQSDVNSPKKRKDENAAPVKKRRVEKKSPAEAAAHASKANAKANDGKTDGDLAYEDDGQNSGDEDKIVELAIDEDGNELYAEGEDEIQAGKKDSSKPQKLVDFEARHADLLQHPDFCDHDKPHFQSDIMRMFLAESSSKPVKEVEAGEDPARYMPKTPVSREQMRSRTLVVIDEYLLGTHSKYGDQLRESYKTSAPQLLEALDEASPFLERLEDAIFNGEIPYFTYDELKDNCLLFQANVNGVYVLIIYDKAICGDDIEAYIRKGGKPTAIYIGESRITKQRGASHFADFISQAVSSNRKVIALQGAVAFFMLKLATPDKQLAKLDFEEGGNFRRRLEGVITTELGAATTDPRLLKIRAQNGLMPLKCKGVNGDTAIAATKEGGQLKPSKLHRNNPTLELCSAEIDLPFFQLLHQREKAHHNAQLRNDGTHKQRVRELMAAYTSAREAYKVEKGKMIHSEQGLIVPIRKDSRCDSLTGLYGAAFTPSNRKRLAKFITKDEDGDEFLRVRLLEGPTGRDDYYDGASPRNQEDAKGLKLIVISEEDETAPLGGQFVLHQTQYPGWVPKLLSFLVSVSQNANERIRKMEDRRVYRVGEVLVPGQPPLTPTDAHWLLGDIRVIVSKQVSGKMDYSALTATTTSVAKAGADKGKTIVKHTNSTIGSQFPQYNAAYSSEFPAWLQLVPGDSSIGHIEHHAIDEVTGYAIQQFPAQVTLSTQGNTSPLRYGNGTRKGARGVRLGPQLCTYLVGLALKIGLQPRGEPVALIPRDPSQPEICTQRCALQKSRPGTIYISFPIGVKMVKQHDIKLTESEKKVLAKRYSLTIPKAYREVHGLVGDDDLLVEIDFWHVASKADFRVRARPFETPDAEFTAFNPSDDAKTSMEMYKQKMGPHFVASQ